MLDWLGDMGGLLDALYLIGTIFMSPFSNFALKALLLSTIFRYRGSEEGLKNRTHTTKKLDFYKSYFNVENLEDKNIL